MPSAAPVIDRSSDDPSRFSPAYRAVVESLPAYLQPFCVDQHYAEYTAEDQCVWRYIMRQHRAFMGEHAHPVYRQGLAATGIGTERIPRIEEMNAALDQLGWRAVCVDGFVPPAIFMEFQAHRVLPISADMRTLTHIVYTPAPDIIHEAAGHAPIVADPEYGAFLQRVGEVGARALASCADHAVYDAVRALSITKEHPNSSDEDIAAAEAALQAAVAAQAAERPSEATRMARFHWWTVEYGLVGDPADPRIYGAGLLSSLEESRHCLGPQVQRRPLGLDCVEQAYDITTMQPQLYVARDWAHLSEVLDALAATFSQRTGGSAGIREAARCATEATAVWSGGLQVSGTPDACQDGPDGQPAWVQFSGPTRLAVAGCDLPGHGTRAHAEGFGSPVGRLAQHNQALEACDARQLQDLGIVQGQQVDLAFASGVRVQGSVDALTRHDGQLVLLGFSEARATAADGSLLFDPAWGRFDMAVGSRISSVFAGPADRNNYHFPPPETSLRNRPVSYTTTQLTAEALYQRVIALRGMPIPDADELATVYARLRPLVGDKWLMLMDILELAERNPAAAELAGQVAAELDTLVAQHPEKQALVERGMALASSADADGAGKG